MTDIKEGENILDNDYPVYPTFVYLVNGKPKTCWLEGTVRQFKRDLIQTDGYEDPEVRSCNLVERGLL